MVNTFGRQNKTSITRTRSGCLQCRHKRRKCDEAKPVCNRCASNGGVCEYGNRLEFRDSTQWAAHKVKQAKFDGRRSQTHDRSRRTNSTSPTSHLPNDFVKDSELALLQDHLSSPTMTPITSIDVQGSVGGQYDKTVFTVDPADASFENSASDQIDSPNNSWPICNGESANMGGVSDATDIGDITGAGFWATLDLLSQSSAESSASDLTKPCEPLYEIPPCQAFYKDIVVPWEPLHAPSSGGSQDDLLPDISEEFPVLTGAEVLTTPWQQWPISPKPPQSLGISIGDRLYLAHFKVSITETLPIQLDYLWRMVMELPPVRYASMALAAASLANLRGKPALDQQGMWVPMHSYSKNATKFAALSRMENDSTITLASRLVMLILLLCYELEAGSLSRVWTALANLDDAVLGSSDQALALPGGHNLVCCWLHLRSLYGVQRRPHAPYGVESQKESLVIELESRVASKSQAIDLIGTRALQICNRILLLKGMRKNGESAKDTIQRAGDWWEIIKGGFGYDSVDASETSPIVLEEEELYEELARLRAALESCEPPKGLPLEPKSVNTLSVEIEPLFFSSHCEAMECADYVFAQLVCDDQVVSRLARSEEFAPSIPPRSESIHPRMHLLLRIAAGLDPVECSRRNMYRKGITTYLQLGARLCASKAGFDGLERFLSSVVKAGVFYEGSFSPTHAVRLFNRALQREMSKGRTAFLAALTYDQWTARETLFSKGMDQHVIIIGREADGKTFNDLVPLVEGEETDGY
ncbi:hypothetical protein BGZ61DRAFT_559867 [Ilyonectria robusta]|uniref:uncharacterized protein n=1 Tax=Ilyonectria robusta TaxID=1079257 RepID=UPI001E8CCD0D|nr:uncharacterized protein BGZ61DRAFT_559867 [Ilyonectria robusta]KAH8734289.1 hypothetical protein BGZ61DRAFT_559867 [Ilyonectria robusta]